MQISVQKGDVVADLGAGSAVLSIAAAKLGARSVAAVEVDADAIPNAEENVALNGVGDVVTIFAGDAGALLPLLAPVDVVVANIISGVLVEILPIIAASLAPAGFAILSGILAEERDEMLEELSGGGWTIADEDYEDEWWSVLIVRQHIPSFPRSRSLPEARSRLGMK
jgi:ribosomal protein L11 methyltransferase